MDEGRNFLERGTFLIHPSRGSGRNLPPIPRNQDCGYRVKDVKTGGKKPSDLVVRNYPGGVFEKLMSPMWNGRRK